MGRKKEENIDAVEEIQKTKGKRGFQKGNKLASREVKTVARIKNGKDLEILKNARASVLEILDAKNISSAHEMIKCIKDISDPEKKFKAWKDVHSFIEGGKKLIDLRLTKTEDKNIRIIYENSDGTVLENRKPIERVIDAEFKEVEDEIAEELQEETDSEDSD